VGGMHVEGGETWVRKWGGMMWARRWQDNAGCWGRVGRTWQRVGRTCARHGKTWWGMMWMWVKSGSTQHGDESGSE